MFFYVMIWYCRHTEITAFAEKCTTEYTTLLTAKNGSDPPPPAPGGLLQLIFEFSLGICRWRFRAPTPL